MTSKSPIQLRSEADEKAPHRRVLHAAAPKRDRAAARGAVFSRTAIGDATATPSAKISTVAPKRYKGVFAHGRTVAGVIALAIGAAVSISHAQSQSLEPANPAPLLEQLSQQTQALHEYVAASLVRVHVPDRAGGEIGPAEELLRKWEQRLEPAVRQKLIEQTAALRSMRSSVIDEDPLAAVRNSLERMNGTVLIVRPFDPADLNEQMPLGIMNPPRGRAALPGTLGIVMDEHGLVLVPAYVDRDVASARPIRVSLPQGNATEAAFVGSDRQTGMTLIRLAIPTGRPAMLATVRPAEGSIVMTFSTQNDGVRLTIWTASGHDAGIVVTPDGRVAGFANANQFLAAPSAVPVLRQLADHGIVRRPLMGIHVTEVHRDDPGRQQVPSLGNQPAMHVDKVLPDSPADRCGLRAGDLILTIADEPVGDCPTFAAAVAARSGKTDLRILREGHVIPVTMTLPEN